MISRSYTRSTSKSESYSTGSAQIRALSNQSIRVVTVSSSSERSVWFKTSDMRSTFHDIEDEFSYVELLEIRRRHLNRSALSVEEIRSMPDVLDADFGAF